MSITPLGQRQIFQTANVESVRVANEVLSLLQRDMTFQKTAETQQAEEMKSIRKTLESDHLKLQDHEKDKHKKDSEQPESRPESQPESDSETPESGLDFLA